ncbi:MAG: PTS system mannitol-specific EIICBA component [Chloroflexi bacterium ADurb.Bin360]|nr:MAG: PTS system mannitol-specific EIICBA component [Chloroflexi bacterium ADurb.Bin360]
MREKIQRFGSFLAAMIIPNMGAFIAWGLLTAFFIPTGWLPNEKLAEMVGPMIKYLLPVLVGFSGGKMVHDWRGGVVGAAATMGVIVGTDVPMFIGAMAMGPLAGFLLKKFDEVVEGKIPSGFEMLVNNFSAGILGLILAILGYWVVGPIVQALTDALGAGVQFLVDRRLLPLADIIVEPAKVLFLNNAINHGIFGPIGVTQVAEKGRSVLFMLESNPGPGLGLLLAYWLAGKGMSKESAPGAIIIHFLGGIHEIYFPYVLAHPIMIVALWAGGILADLWFVITGAGLVATPSPGSIFAYLAVTPKGQHFFVLAGIAIAAVASFLVGSFLLKVFPVKEDA